VRVAPKVKWHSARRRRKGRSFTHADVGAHAAGRRK
jgi:hypothetical protein